MKIVFVCTTCEPQRDGVGDHIRLLANYIQTLGISVAILAVSDIYVTSDIEDIQNNIRVTRFKFSENYNVTSRKVGHYFSENSCDWFILHYVIYGYNPKGVPIGHEKIFSLVPKSVHKAIYFHELWVGKSKLSSLKHKIIGLVQKKMIKRMIKVVSPVFIQTSGNISALVLSDSGIDSEVWPMFGNIEVESVFSESVTRFFEENFKNRNEWVLIGVFGTVYPGFDPGDALNECARVLDKKVALILIGRSGEFDVEKLMNSCVDIPVFRTNEISSSLVSQYMQMIDVGLSTTPWLWCEKSGTVASWLDHGRPVLIFDNGDQLICNEERYPQKENVFVWRKGEYFDWNRLLNRSKYRNSAKETAVKLVERLGKSDK